MARLSPTVVTVVAFAIGGCGARSGLDTPEWRPATGPAPTTPGRPLTCSPITVFRRDFPGRNVSDLLVRDDGVVVNLGTASGPAESRVHALAADGTTVFETTLPGLDGRLFAMGDGYVETQGQSEARFTYVSHAGVPGWTLVEKSGAVLVAASDGASLYAAGNTDLTKAFLHRITSDGVLVWTKAWSEPTSPGAIFKTETLPFGAYVDGAGRLVVGHKVWVDGSGGPAHLRGFDANGDPFFDHLDPSSYDRGASWVLLPLPDGGFLYTGDERAGPGEEGPSRVTRFGATFQQLASVSLVEATPGQQIVSSAISAKDGHVILGGYASVDVSARAWDLGPDLSTLARFSRTNAPVLPELATLVHLREHPSGDLILGIPTGSPKQEPSGWKIARVTRAFAPVWVTTVVADGFPIQFDLAVLPTGRVALAGFVATQGTPNAVVAVVDGVCEP